MLDSNGKARVVHMGSYGIGVSRAVAAIAGAYHDERGLAWPVAVAPMHVHVVATGRDEAVFEAAERLAGELQAQRLEVLYDDRRKVSPGVKFADAELLGAPVVLVVGRGLADGNVELRLRAGGVSEEIAVDEAVSRVVGLVDSLR